MLTVVVRNTLQLNVLFGCRSPLTTCEFIYAAGQCGIMRDDPSALEPALDVLARSVHENVTGYTPPQMIKVLSGFTLLGQGVSADMLPALLGQYIRAGEDASKLMKNRKRAMSRVVFSILLEQPQLLEKLPRWQHTAVDSYNVPWEFRVERQYHPRLARLLEGVPGAAATVLAKKGPFHVDLRLKIEAGPHTGVKVGVDFVDENAVSIWSFWNSLLSFVE